MAGYAFTTACRNSKHAACEGTTSRQTPCYCACHDDSFACKNGAHAFCERSLCDCTCGHKTTHATVAERQKWAA